MKRVVYHTYGLIALAAVTFLFATPWAFADQPPELGSCSDQLSYNCLSPCTKVYGAYFNCCSTHSGGCCERICRQVYCINAGGPHPCVRSVANWAAGVEKEGTCNQSTGFCEP